MRLYFKLLIVFLSTLFLSGCDKNNINLPGCETSNTDFSQLYTSATATSGADDRDFMDTEIHEYHFQLSTQQEICAIGYESQPAIENTPYTIELEDLTNGSLVYSGVHTFSSAGTSYVATCTQVVLQPGIDYAIRRVQTNWAGNIGNTIGRVLWAGNAGLVLPQTFGDLTITETHFYQNGGPSTNTGLPYIDIVFSD